MNYTENYKGIKIDVQAVNIDISAAVQEEIRASIDKLLRFTANIVAVDIYFKTEGQNHTLTQILGVRLGIPGPDAFAETRGGDNWISMMKETVEKLIRQVQKNK